jgi:AcrR family transcriptional regulator
MPRDKTVNIKELILNEGIRLFLDKGYNATTIEDITDAVNITKGAFYWHFKSKDELLETILNLFEASFTDSVIQAVQNYEGTFLTKMKYTHKWVTEFAYQHRELCVGVLTILAEMVGSQTEIAARARRIYSKYVDFLKDLLSLGKQEGYIRDDLDTDMVAHIINAIHNGSLLEWHINYNEIDGALFARTYRDITLLGLLKNKANTRKK